MALLLGPPPFQCAAHDYRFRRSLKAQHKSRPLPTGSYDTSQPVVDGVTELCYPGGSRQLLLNPNVISPFLGHHLP